MTTKLTLSPQQASYNLKPGEQTIHQKLEGGASKFRQDILNPNSTLKCQWFCSALQYNYLMAFYKTVAKAGANAFLIDLIVDDGSSVTEHEAHFIPNSLALTGVNGLTYTVTAELEIKPLEEDETYNRGLVDVYNAYGKDAEELLNILEHFINVELPSINAFN